MVELVCLQTGEILKVKHYQFLKWPDFGVPEYPQDFLSLLNRVRGDGVLEVTANQGPAVVHCSAGIGRSGSFCLIDSALKLVPIVA